MVSDLFHDARPPLFVCLFLTPISCQLGFCSYTLFFPTSGCLNATDTPAPLFSVLFFFPYNNVLPPAQGRRFFRTPPFFQFFALCDIVRLYRLTSCPSSPYFSLCFCFLFFCGFSFCLRQNLQLDPSFFYFPPLPPPSPSVSEYSGVGLGSNFFSFCSCTHS